MISKRMGIMMKCEICGNSIVEMIHKGTRDNPDVDVYKCKNCETKFLNKKILNPDNFYSEGNMHNSLGRDKMIQERLNESKEDDKRKAELVKGFIKNKSICDFGCGFGGSISYMSGYATSICGVELEDEAFNYLVNKGIRVERNIDSYKGEQFDVITLFHVFEHLENPRQWLEVFKDYLTEDGVLFLEVPHSNDALLELYNCDKFADFTYWSPHLFLYNENSFNILADECGYNIKHIERIQRYTLPNHLYWLSKGKGGGRKYGTFLMMI